MSITVSEKIKQDRLQRQEKCVKSYESSLQYWTSNRQIMKSNRLNQTQEFISEQVKLCKERIAYHKRIIEAILNNVKWADIKF